MWPWCITDARHVDVCVMKSGRGWRASIWSSKHLFTRRAPLVKHILMSGKLRYRMALKYTYT